MLILIWSIFVQLPRWVDFERATRCSFLLREVQAGSCKRFVGVLLMVDWFDLLDPLLLLLDCTGGRETISSPVAN